MNLEQGTARISLSLTGCCRLISAGEACSGAKYVERRKGYLNPGLIQLRMIR